MLSTDAAALLDGVRALHEERFKWVELVALDVAVTSAVEGAVTMRWLVDERQLRELVLGKDADAPSSTPPEVFLLPVVTSGSTRLPLAETISMIGARGTRPLTGLHCDTLRRVAELNGGATQPRDHDEVLAVPVTGGDLTELAELVVKVPLVPHYARGRARRRLPRPLRALNPVGLLDVSLWQVEPKTSFGLVLPDEVQADTAVLTIPATMDASVDVELRQLREELAGFPRRWLRGPIVARQFDRMVPVVHRAAKELGAEVRHLDEISRSGVDVSGARGAVGRDNDRMTTLLHELEQRAATAEEQGRAALESTKRLVRLVDRAREAYRPAGGHRIISTLSPDVAADGAFVAACPAAPIEEITVVYSTRQHNLRLNRLGTSRSLIVLGFVLLLLAWRLQIMWPLGRQEAHPIDLVQADTLRTSRDALIALLVIFPALLFTQLERMVADRSLLDQTAGVVLTCASVAFVLPVVVGVLAAGDIRPSLVILSCTLTGIVALGVGIGVAVFLGEPIQSRLRRRQCGKMVAR